MSEKVRQLSTLFDLREKERDEKRVAFAKVAEEIRSLEDFLRKIREAIEAAKKEVNDARQKLTTVVSERQVFNAFRMAKEAEISDYRSKEDEVQQAIKNAQKILEEKRSELVDAEAKLKAVEKTLERESAEVRKKRAKKAEDEADEIAQSRWSKQ